MSASPITIAEDTVAGQKYTEDLKQGKTRVRVFKVFNLTDSRDPLYQAKMAVDGNKRIPLLGEFHPVVPDVFVQNVEAEHFNPSWRQARVVCTYSSLPTTPGVQFVTDIRINGTSQRINTQYDASGKKKWVYYAGPNSPYTGKDQNALARAYSAKSANVLREPAQGPTNVSVGIIEIDTIRRGNPMTPFGYLIGSANKKPFQGDPAGTWILRDILSHTNFPATLKITAKLLWQCTYIFERSIRGNGFVNFNVFRDSRTGVVPGDVADVPNTQIDGNVYGKYGGGNGVAGFDDIPRQDWSALGLIDLSSM